MIMCIECEQHLFNFIHENYSFSILKCCFFFLQGRVVVHTCSLSTRKDGIKKVSINNKFQRFKLNDS